MEKILMNDCRNYESVDDKRLSDIISQKLAENIIIKEFMTNKFKFTKLFINLRSDLLLFKVPMVFR